MICSTCFDVIHAKCSKQPSHHTIQARIPRYYTCNRCLHTQLPFFNVSNLDSSYDMCNTANDNRLSIQNTKSNITNSNKTISVVHLNTQAICSTFDEFTCMLNTQKFDIMTLSETWLKDNPHLLDYVKLDGYEVKFRNREHTRGGGVDLYIRSDIKYKLRNGIVNANTDIEHLWLEVALRNKNSNLLLGIFYQPNFDNLAKSIWLDKFDDILTYACSRWNNSIVISGDMNYDLSKPDELIQKRYLSILWSHNLNQHVKKPTRKSAILDHIITNSIAKDKNVNVIPCPEVSDNDAPYITLSTKFAPFEPHYKIIRDMKNFRQQDFIDSFATLPFELVYAFNDSNDMISVFNELISNHINEHAPLKTIRVTRPAAPWKKYIDIVDLQQKCHQLRTLCHTTNRETDWNDFRNVRNKLKTKFKSTKSSFYRKALSSIKSSEVWKVIHKIINPNGKSIRINPNELNKHFSTTSKRLTC